VTVAPTMPRLAWMPNVVDSGALEGDGYELTRLGKPLADYLAAKTVAGREDKTLRDKRAYVGAFALMWPDLELAHVEPRHVLHYLAIHQKRLAASSLRARYTHLNDFFNWCVAWDLMSKNPMRQLEPPRRQGKKVYDLFSDAEVELLCGLPLIDGALMTVMLDAGLRRSECCRMRPRDIREGGLHGRIAIVGGKGGKDRLVPMTRRLATALALLQGDSQMGPTDYFWYVRVNQGRTVKRDRPIGDGSFQRWWDRCLDDAGVRRRNPHMTRHTYATRWLRRGGRLETLSMNLGHASLTFTKDAYGHLDINDADRDLAAIEAFEL
jgi:integrase/recombinase XerD